MSERIYSPGEICRMLNIQFYTLAYLETTGQIPKAPRTGANRRYYTDELFEQIRLKLLQRYTQQDPGGQNETSGKH
jgi:DNA-binding transcriptional MerR regulator